MNSNTQYMLIMEEEYKVTILGFDRDRGLLHRKALQLSTMDQKAKFRVLKMQEYKCVKNGETLPQPPRV